MFNTLKVAQAEKQIYPESRVKLLDFGFERLEPAFGLAAWHEAARWQFVRVTVVGRPQLLSFFFGECARGKVRLLPETRLDDRAWPAVRERNYARVYADGLPIYPDRSTSDGWMEGAHRPRQIKLRPGLEPGQ
jgi:hypothetical protein